MARFKARKVTASTGSTRVDAERTARREGRRLSSRKAVSRSAPRLRVPIALKFSTLIALLAVVFMTWQTLVTIRTAVPQLDGQINQGGLELVSALASAVTSRQGALGAEDLAALLESFNRSRGSERVLNVIVYDAAGEALATARRESGFTRTRGEAVAFAPAEAAGVAIREFEYEGIPVRSFRRTLGGNLAGGHGAIEAYVSAQDIADARDRLTRALVTVSVGACVAAAVAAFFLARLLSRPIRVLLKDMRVVSTGDLTHESQVNSSDELGDLARTFNIMTRNLQIAQQARMAQKALEHELALATQIQARLLPHEVPQVDGLDIAAYYVSAKEVGGDYYDFIPIQPNHLGIVVADVSGKGIPAALVMTMTRSLLRMASAKEISPLETVVNLDRALTADMTPGMFVSLVYCVVDLASHETQLVRCGHNAPFLYRAGTRKLLAVRPGGMAIGLDRRGGLFAAELQVQRIALCSGDALALYSDGIIEAKNSDGADYGEERFAQLLAAHSRSTAQDLIELVMDDVEKHRRGAVQSDDITLLVIRKE